MTRTMRILLSTALLGALISGCGLKGDLETPPPLWGDPGRTASERSLPGGEGRDSDDIVFTRDDVDIFNDEDEDADPFAEDEETPDADPPSPDVTPAP